MSTPAYQRIVDDITGRIASGELRPGQELPSITQMAAQYDTSQATVKIALIQLRAAGLVRGVQGKATYVTDDPPVG